MSIDAVILIVVVLLVGVPLLTFVHELGHALVAVFAVGGRVTVIQGPDPARARFSVGRLDFRMHGLPLPHQTWIGWAHWDESARPRRQALALAGGPAASLLSAAACFTGALASGGTARFILFVLAGDAAAQLTSTSLPVRYPAFSGQYAGHASDGFQVRQLLTVGVPHPDPALPAPMLRDHAATSEPAARVAAPAPPAARS